MSKVLASFAKSLSLGDDGNRTQNGVFVHTQLLPLMIKLQKEIRGRKYKEVQGTLQDAVVALHDFEKEEWPPKRNGEKKDDLEEEETAETESTDSTHEAVVAAATEDGEPSSSPTARQQQQQLGDDPQTREPVHPAIEATLEALIAVMNHPAKVTKPCELGLEGVTLLVANRYVSGRAGGQDDLSGSGAGVMEMAQKQQQQGSGSGHRLQLQLPAASLLHRLMESVAKLSESNVESIQMAVIKTMRTIMTSPKCGVHEASMLLASRSTFHVYLVASNKSQACKEAAKTALVDMLRSVIGRMEAYDAVTKSQQALHHRQRQQKEPKENGHATENGNGRASSSSEQTAEDSNIQDHENEDDDAKVSAFASQYHADSYALFRSLCKMSSKELAADTENDSEYQRSSVGTLFTTMQGLAASSDAMQLTSKILSLELILAAIDFSGDAFCTGERFVYLVQHYLCVSLLKNCMSNNTQVAFLSQKIFLNLVYKFKGHLKHEIEVFMSNIFLRVLESPNSSFKQKALVLESLRSLCRDPVLLTQIFLNYDCDFDARNLYKEIVHMLTKLGGKATSAPSSAVSKKDAEEDFELSLAGLEVLTTILKAFMRALGLPGSSDDDATDDSAGSRLRGMLQLDVGLAAKPAETTRASTTDNSVASAEEMSVSDQGSRSRQQEADGGETVSSADAAGKIVDAFEMKKKTEQNFEIGAVKFTLSLKSGLNFFFDNGFVERDARSVALFFLAHKDKLDKTQMGEVLGKEPDSSLVKGDGIDPEKGGPGFWVRILHHYVDALDFTGLQFDEAIRLFLSGFRLPGEAQKIDRIMEKFAERYTAQNPDVFPSADTAFILAFSVIMLNTDLHNPSIKPERRMTIDSFIRNNSGIGENGGDLPEDFLVGIFNRIKQKPFSLKEDDAARERAGAQKQMFEASVFFESSSIFGLSAEERKRERFKKERDEMMAVTQQLVRRRADKSSKASLEPSSRLAETVAPADVVMPMFDVTWGPMLGILSQVLECSDDENCVAVCLNGFVYAVRIAAHSNMSLARDTFVTSLAKFTFLGSIKEMKKKNVESIRTLLSIAVIDGECLGDSWTPVLECISQLARLRLSASGLDSDESFLMEQELPKKAATPNRVELFRQQPTREEIARETEEINGRAVLEAVQEVLIDKVFSATVTLSAKSLAQFIEQLIQLSSLEIKSSSERGKDSSGSVSLSKSGHGPSIFLLQKLVEVADCNMNVRPRLVWAQVWEMMADYFAKIACNENAMVSVFAIDSLKQLSLKFLEKPELSEFNFQRIFLNPFLVVMEDKGSGENVREMVLRCVDNVIRTKSRNLRSGWKIVFSILRRSANDPSEKVDFLGLSILQRLLDEHLHELCSLSDGKETAEVNRELSSVEKRNRNANVDDFVGLCRASLSFVQQQESDSPRPIGLSMRAFSHTAIYADLLAARRVLPPVSGAQWADPNASGYTYSGLSDEEALEMALWRPLFEGIADGIRSTARSSAGGVGCLLQRGSVMAFRAILLRHGHTFTTSQWAAILGQTLIPAIQAGAENDTSPVIGLTSESPSVSSIDFLVDPLPLPPPIDDPSLLGFEALNASQNRSMGPAELMLEASFTDLRYGGDGDLRKAYALAKKEESSAVAIEQPFPDSWIATTAPIAFGLLTDIACETVVKRSPDGREKLWPLIASQYKLWCIGQHAGKESDKMEGKPWRPCEALVRTSCREVHRFLTRLAKMNAELSSEDAASWAATVLDLFSDLLSESAQKEETTRRDLIQSKKEALVELHKETGSLDDEEDAQELVVTAYGKGKLLEKRSVRYKEVGKPDTKVIKSVIQLDWGTLYQPVIEPTSSAKRRKSENGIPLEVSVPGAYWEQSVPELKIRCVAAYCLQQSIADVADQFVPLASRDNLSMLLVALNGSRFTAESTVVDEDIATAFQEALLTAWGGDGVAAVEEALESAARLSHLHGSSMFFLAQEAGATHATIRMLSILYTGSTEHKADDGGGWDREVFAEPHLINIIVDVLGKFLASEEKDGHLIDVNVWRNATERGGKVALYCTSFAFVVVEILKIIGSMRADQFAKHKQELFPLLCNLIRVPSDEIRHLVQEIFMKQVAPMLGVEIKA